MLKAIVENLDEVAEPFRPEYEEREGKWYLKVEDGVQVFGAGAKKKADQLLSEKKQIEDKLRRFSIFDGIELDNLDADTLKAALDLHKEHKDKNPNKDQEVVEKLLKKRDDEWKPKVDEQKERAEKAEAELRRYKLDLVVKDAALKGGVRPERVDYAMRINAHRFDLDEKGNPVILDKDGDPISISLETFWKDEWKTGNEDFYVGHNAGGSGASGSNGRRAGGPDLSKLSPAERMKAARRLEATK
jgi:hypothetical protein